MSYTGLGAVAEGATRTMRGVTYVFHNGRWVRKRAASTSTSTTTAKRLVASSSTALTSSTAPALTTRVAATKEAAKAPTTSLPKPVSTPVKEAAAAELDVAVKKSEDAAKRIPGPVRTSVSASPARTPVEPVPELSPLPEITSPDSMTAKAGLQRFIVPAVAIGGGALLLYILLKKR